MRPTDWFLVGLAVDPVPGDAFGIRALAAKYAAIAATADDAARAVHAARMSGAASEWIGDAGDIFRDRSHGMPGEFAHAHESYAAVDAALRRWADTIDDTQAQADRGLQHAREAHADRATAASVLANAELAWTTAHAQQLTYQALEKSPLSTPLPPASQLRSTERAAQHARSAMAAARDQIADADARLAAARALVLEAKERRDNAERSTVHAIAAAGDLAVPPSSAWEAIQDSAAWQTIVAVATVVVTVVSIVAIFVGGPLVWALILAATILLVVDALLSIAQGKDAWGELALLAVGMIPGGRLLGLAARGLSSVGRVGAAISPIANLTAGLRSGAAQGLQTVVRRLADETGEVRLPNPPRWLPWREVKFSQRSVTYSKFDRATHEHYTYDDMVKSMRTNGWVGKPIDVVDLGDHGITSVDNTRLLAAREANIQVHAVIHHAGDILTNRQADRFEVPGIDRPQTWGDAVYGRIADQWDGWGAANPHGSFDAPLLTGRPR